MKNALAISFAGLALVSILVWIGGILTAAVVPWFGGIRATHIGEIGLTLGILGEAGLYGFGWITKRLTSKRERDHSSQLVGLSGLKRYGNKKEVA
jgi:hypothetical protein